MLLTDVEGKPYWAAVGFHSLTNRVLKWTACWSAVSAELD